MGLYVGYAVEVIIAQKMFFILNNKMFVFSGMINTVDTLLNRQFVFLFFEGDFSRCF